MVLRALAVVLLAIITGSAQNPLESAQKVTAVALSKSRQEVSASHEKYTDVLLALIGSQKEDDTLVLQYTDKIVLLNASYWKFETDLNEVLNKLKKNKKVYDFLKIHMMHQAHSFMNFVAGHVSKCRASTIQFSAHGAKRNRVFKRLLLNEVRAFGQLETSETGGNMGQCLDDAMSHFAQQLKAQHLSKTQFKQLHTILTKSKTYFKSNTVFRRHTAKVALENLEALKFATTQNISGIKTALEVLDKEGGDAMDGLLDARHMVSHFFQLLDAAALQNADDGNAESALRKLTTKWKELERDARFSHRRNEHHTGSASDSGLGHARDKLLALIASGISEGYLSAAWLDKSASRRRRLVVEYARRHSSADAGLLGCIAGHGGAGGGLNMNLDFPDISGGGGDSAGHSAGDAFEVQRTKELRSTFVHTLGLHAAVSQRQRARLLKLLLIAQKHLSLEVAHLALAQTQCGGGSTAGGDTKALRVAISKNFTAGIAHIVGKLKGSGTVVTSMRNKMTGIANAFKKPVEGIVLDLRTSTTAQVKRARAKLHMTSKIIEQELNALIALDEKVKSGKMDATTATLLNKFVGKGSHRRSSPDEEDLQAVLLAARDYLHKLTPAKRSKYHSVGDALKKWQEHTITDAGALLVVQQAATKGDKIDLELQRAWLGDDCSPPTGNEDEGGLWADNGSVGDDDKVKELIKLELPLWPAAAEKMVAQLQHKVLVDQANMKEMEVAKHKMVMVVGGLGGIVLVLVAILLCGRRASAGGDNGSGAATVRRRRKKKVKPVEAPSESEEDGEEDDEGHSQHNGFDKLEDMPAQEMKLASGVRS
jgi:hypothetical protein